MAPSSTRTEVYTYNPFVGVDSVRLRAQSVTSEPESLTAEILSPQPTKPALRRETMKLTGLLDAFKSKEVTPIVGTEFTDANVVDWMKGPNSDEMLRELAVTSTYNDILSLPTTP